MPKAPQLCYSSYLIALVALGRLYPQLSDGKPASTGGPRIVSLPLRKRRQDGGMTLLMQTRWRPIFHDMRLTAANSPSHEDMATRTEVKRFQRIAKHSFIRFAPYLYRFCSFFCLGCKTKSKMSTVATKDLGALNFVDNGTFESAANHWRLTRPKA